MVLELRPAHDPTRAYGFVGVVVSLTDLSASIWLWYRGRRALGNPQGHHHPGRARRPRAAAAAAEGLRRGAAAGHRHQPVARRRLLYVSCWGTGELKQYDVSDPLAPREVGSVRIGGIVDRTAHPRSGPLTGGPQMVEVSRDGRRVYFTNSLYASWDEQFYPDGVSGLDDQGRRRPRGGIAIDPDFFVDFGSRRPHQVRLQGGDASSDSYCYP